MALDTTSLTLGPLFFHWPENKVRDFYARIADEAPVDRVCLGEVVCFKRTPFQDWLPDVMGRLERAGKQVILSSLGLIMNVREMESVRGVTEMADRYLIEANDMAAVSLLAGRRHALGPTINIYNTTSLGFHMDKGAAHICLPAELSLSSLCHLGAARQQAVLEIQVFGRLPLAISARCYHARAHGRSKDNCQYACAEDSDGMVVETMDAQPFFLRSTGCRASHTAMY